MELSNYRQEIDEIDGRLVELLKKRLAVSEEIGRFKAENRLPIYDPQREREKLAELALLAENRAAGFIGSYGADARFADGVLTLNHANILFFILKYFY